MVGELNGCVERIRSCHRRARPGLGLLLVTLLLGVGVLPVAGQTSNRLSVVPGAQYQAGWLHRFLFGTDYRDLWATPIEVPVLDLRSYAGGLTPVRTGGFGQTSSLHFDGADGRRYVFRSVDKDPSRRLAEELQGTFIESIIQDQISALNPGAALIVAPILQAAGVLTSEPALYVMPDDPLIGAYRAEFSGMLGLMMENPDEGADDTPGFAEARLISGSERALEDVEGGPEDRFDKRAFLKARLLDVLLGDRDRHIGQWRWARFETDTGNVWVPIPEDRDQAFIQQDGVVMWTTRKFFSRKFVAFGEAYPPIESVTWNGWDLDRHILTELPLTVWDSMAVDLQERLTDDVIEGAVQNLPAAFYVRRGATLSRALSARRDSLRSVARDYYLMLSRHAEVRGTDVDELAIAEWVHPNALDVTLFRMGDDGEPLGNAHFRRRFDVNETNEVRLFMHGGDDRIEVRGRGQGMTVRVVGGGGADTFIDRSSGNVFLYDAGDRSEFHTGARTRVDRREYEPPPSSDPAHAHPVDWGTWTRPIPILSYSPDIGLYVGAGVVHDRYGFRAHPYKSKIWFRSAWATTAALPTIELVGDFRNIGRAIHGALDLGVSGIEIIRFHGFGNETPEPLAPAFHKVEQLQARIAPSLIVSHTPSFSFSFGPILKYAHTDEDATTLLNVLNPYGTGTFGQVGGRAGVSGEFGRETPKAGVTLAVQGALFPPVWDVVDVFGSVAGFVKAHIGNGSTAPQLAVRAGGRRVWGAYPFHEAAYIGGSTTLRGFAEQRFAGDAAIYGNAELRIPVGAFPFILPTRFGVMGLADVGRVFIDGESSDTWHSAFGGGMFFSVLSMENTLSVAVARSDERIGAYVSAGFMF